MTHIMNDTFNIRRFNKLFSTDFRTCVSNFGLSISLISLMGLIIYAGTIVMGLIFKNEWGGPELGFRASTFIVCMIILIVTMPVKCYGAITDKRAGTDWIMIPASQIEKTLSMIIMTVFVAPAIVGGVYLSIDALLCGLDKTCGESIFHAIATIRPETLATDQVLEASVSRFLNQITSPWLYIDDIIGVSLIFLLGAIFFQKGKTVKTLLAIMAACTVISMVMIPIAQQYFNGMIPAEGIHTIEEAEPFLNSFIFKHVALADTINDTIVNLILVAGIFLRVKTLKH